METDMRAAADAAFNTCVTRNTNARGRHSVECKLGLWSVNGTDAGRVESEARRYWRLYFEDGEYDSILGPDDVATEAVKPVHRCARKLGRRAMAEPKKKWIPIADTRVRHIWVRDADDDCGDCGADGDRVAVSPDWYQENGTPICGCGLDLVYLMTEIEVAAE